MFTDKDSITYEIKSKDVYEEFSKHKHLFDFSDYWPELFDKINEKVPGEMKYEFKGIITNKCIQLKSKMYYIFSADKRKVNIARGVNISTEFTEYKDILFNENIIRQKMKRVPSKKCKIGTSDANKMSCFDDKDAF